MIPIKSARQIEMIRAAGVVVSQILDEITSEIRPGVSTLELDQFAERRCLDLGARPAFKDYQGFPASLCVSVNHEVAHGIPSSQRILREGDIVGVDFGVKKEGWYADSARTYSVGKISSAALKLLRVTKEALQRGIEACQVGAPLMNIGYAVQSHVEEAGFSVVRELAGHGIGKELHEAPALPNFGRQGLGEPLELGMVLAIEPMINQGAAQIRLLEDQWTFVSQDQSLSAHFEHTVAITKDGPEVLTESSLSSF